MTQKVTMKTGGDCQERCGFTASVYHVVLMAALLLLANALWVTANDRNTAMVLLDEVQHNISACRDSMQSGLDLYEKKMEEMRTELFKTTEEAARVAVISSQLSKTAEWKATLSSVLERSKKVANGKIKPGEDSSLDDLLRMAKERAHKELKEWERKASSLEEETLTSLQERLATLRNQNSDRLNEWLGAKIMAVQLMTETNEMAKEAKSLQASESE